MPFVHLSWRFTGDGLLAFAGGALALIGVWWSNRQSIKNLQKQLEAERGARDDEAKGQNRAVATAIAFEIDSIYRGFVRDVVLLFETAGADASFEQDLLAKRIGTFPFTVYMRCAQFLGRLPPPLAEGIVHFYGGASVYLITFTELYTALQPAQAASLGDARRAKVNALVQQVKETSVHLGKLAAEVSERLCEFAEIPRDRMAALPCARGIHAQKN
jgi:hypothetical protein